jgi:hypothetical protein
MARLVHENSLSLIVQVRPVLSNNIDTYWSSTAVRIDRCRMHSMPVRTLRKVIGCVSVVSFLPHNEEAWDLNLSSGFSNSSRSLLEIDTDICTVLCNPHKFILPFSTIMRSDHSLVSRFPLVFTIRSWQRIYNTGTAEVPQNYALTISIYYSTHKVFKSRVKSSQADLFYSCVLLVPVRSELSELSERLSLYSRGKDMFLQ